MVVIPMGVIGLFSVHRASRALTDVSEGQAYAVAEAFAGMTQLVMEAEIQFAREISAGNATQAAARTIFREGAAAAGPEIDALNRKLRKAMETVGRYYEAFLVADASGRIYADSAQGQYVGLSIEDRKYFRAAKETLAPHVGTIVRSQVTQNPVAPVCAPLLSDAGELMSMVVAVLRVEYLVEKIVSVEIGETGYPFLLNADGVAIAHPDPSLILEADVDHLEGMEVIARRISRGESGVERYRFQGVAKVAGFVRIPLTGWTMVATQNISEFLTPSHRLRNTILLVGAGFLLLTLIVMLVLSRRIVSPIRRSAEQVGGISREVAAAASQVSSSSQVMARSAGEQAASIQETTVSVEEIAALIRGDVENAREVEAFRHEAFKALQSAESLMGRTIEAMASIRSKGESVGSIVKNIDDIAFQTNLLALNAAIEAARAGDSGAGFAVVAGEVRNLAMKAAEAARNSGEVLEAMATEIEQGGRLIDETQKAFEATRSRNLEVAKRIDGILGSARDQAGKVESITAAVHRMDRTTQSSAANAQETAAAAEQMHAQSEGMNGVVADLMAVIGAGGPKRRKDRTDGNGKRIGMEGGGRSAEGPSKRRP